jgi:hypothetical protein
LSVYFNNIYFFVVDEFVEEDFNVVAFVDVVAGVVVVFAVVDVVAGVVAVVDVVAGVVVVVDVVAGFDAVVPLPDVVAVVGAALLAIDICIADATALFCIEDIILLSVSFLSLRILL